MKGMVALTGLEAMSNGIQFVKNEDASRVKWGKKQMPNLKGLWSSTAESRALDDWYRLHSCSMAV